MNTFNKGDRVKHEKYGEGTIACTPYARSAAVKVKFDIHETAQYFRKEQLTPMNGTLPAPAAAKTSPLKPGEFRTIGIDAIAERQRREITSPEATRCEPTLEELVKQCQHLRAELSDLEDVLIVARLTEMLRGAFARAQSLAAPSVAALSLDAAKIERDTRQAMNAAKRLSEKGFL